MTTQATTNRLPIRSDVQTITYWRPPTTSEIKFGYGAVHYRDFTPEQVCHKGTAFTKRWIKAKDDGLRYYRR